MRSRCSMAAGLNCNNSVVACIASATDLKKINATPFSFGSRTIFNSAEMIAASVPSLPQMRLIRFPGSFWQRALRAGQPQDLEPGEIEARLGSPWIPASDVRDFLTELLNVPRGSIKVAFA